MGNQAEVIDASLFNPGAARADRSNIRSQLEALLVEYSGLCTMGQRRTGRKADTRPVTAFKIFALANYACCECM